MREEKEGMEKEGERGRRGSGKGEERDEKRE